MKKSKLFLRPTIAAILVAVLCSALSVEAVSKKATKKSDPTPQASSGAIVPQVLEGELRDKSGENLLFKFKREVFAQGPEKRVLRTYTDPQGEVAMTEELFYENDKLKRFLVKQNQLNQEGELEVKEGKLNFRYTKENKTSTDDEDFEEPLIPSDQIVAYLQGNWPKLESGETLKIRFPVLDRKETVGFNFKIDKKDQKYKGKDVHIIKMWPSSFVIAAVVKPIYFTFEKAGEKRCFVVDGRTAPKQKVDGKWKDLDALMLFHQASL